MKTYSKEKTLKILKEDPTVLFTGLNQLGQTVKLIEHPFDGDECPVLALIDHHIANTGMWDCEDVVTTVNGFMEPTEYMPCLVNGEINCAMDFNL